MEKQRPLSFVEGAFAVYKIIALHTIFVYVKSFKYYILIIIFLFTSILFTINLS